MSVKICYSPNFEYKICPCSNLSYAVLIGEDLRSDDLRCANLSHANLNGADLTNADLRGANLYTTNLQFADLKFANLYKANLSYANLRGANLYKPNLTNANLDGARIEDIWYEYIKNQNVINFDNITWLLTEENEKFTRYFKEVIYQKMYDRKEKFEKWCIEYNEAKILRMKQLEDESKKEKYSWGIEKNE